MYAVEEALSPFQIQLLIFDCFVARLVKNLLNATGVCLDDVYGYRVTHLPVGVNVRKRELIRVREPLQARPFPGRHFADAFRVDFTFDPRCRFQIFLAVIHKQITFAPIPPMPAKRSIERSGCVFTKSDIKMDCEKLKYNRGLQSEEAGKTPTDGGMLSYGRPSSVSSKACNMICAPLTGTAIPIWRRTLSLLP